MPPLRWWRPKSKVLAVKTTRKTQDAWLDNLILATGLVRDASDVALCHPLKFAATIVFQVLEKIQTARKNEDDFKDLSQSLVDVVTTIRDNYLSMPPNRPLPREFTNEVQKFTNELLYLQIQINESVRKTHSWTRYFRSRQIANAIGGYNARVNNLRLNLIMNIVLSMYKTMYEQRTPRQLQYTANLLSFVDAMNIRTPVPMEICLTPENFHTYVKLLFRARLGHEVVERGYYALSLLEPTGTYQTLERTSESWALLVRPGVTITMDIISSSQYADMDNDSRQCPLCHFLCINATLGDEVICPRCSTFFRVSRAVIEEVGAIAEQPPTDDANGASLAVSQPQSASPPRKRSDQYCIRPFRRILVLLGTCGTRVDKEMELADASTASTPVEMHSNLELPSFVPYLPPRQLLRL